MARYDGNGSYWDLLKEKYGVLTSIWANGGWQPSSGPRELGNQSKINPFSLLFSGRYFQQGNLYRQPEGFYAEKSISNNASIFVYYFSNYQFNPKDRYGRIDGYSLRCVAKPCFLYVGAMSTFATDSICPKGWEMARYDGDGSWQQLIVTVYGKNIVGTEEVDTEIKLNPLSLIRAGSYLHNSGISNGQNIYGYYWNFRIRNINESYGLYFHSTYFSTQNSNIKNRGFSLRCVAKIV